MFIKIDYRSLLLSITTHNNHGKPSNQISLKCTQVSTVKYHFFSLEFNRNKISTTDFLKIHNKMFHEIQQVKWQAGCSATEGRTDGQADMMELTIAFSHCVNAPKIT